MNDVVHIVCLDAPSPPDYGGAIDMYYKVVALAKAGKKIILHYFDYHEERNAEGLKSYCHEIHHYKRNKFFSHQSLHLPFIVRSRINQQLLDKLNQDDHPILLEGIHCTGIIPLLQKNRKIILRLHNEEATYYQFLSTTESNFIKKAYMRLESFLIKRYYQQLPRSLIIAAISTSDIEVIRTKYHITNLNFIPCFLPWQDITSKTDIGGFCLYHGNMQVSENVAAVEWLLKNVFSKIDVPFVVAGKGIPQNLLLAERRQSNVQLINNPSLAQINTLVSTAHVNVLPSFNQTGVKLKLLHALFQGRFCITNRNGLTGSEINQGILIAEDAVEYVKMITELFSKPFTREDIKKRQQLLSIYNNDENAVLLNGLL